ncbi:ABC transporter permease [Bacillus daqingensis]|uniref:ABC transporter permease n=1 Tax=Bacillus daqingensis TaxID=872396 RepID=A0ABV9NW53_9BACI
MMSPFDRTWRLTRLLVRRDRIRLTGWLFGITAATVLTAAAFPGLYTTEAERQQLALSMINPAVTALVGPGHGLDNYTYGPMMAHQMLGLTALIVAVMAVLLTVRYTRADEEEGRTEMVRALAVGRSAPLMSALLVMTLLSGAIGFANAVGLGLLRLEGMDWTGSLHYGAVLSLTGLFFTGITLITAQLAETSRAASGMAIIAAVGAYAVRAVGDISLDAFTWFSPFGWLLAAETYVNNYVWPLLLTFAVSVAAVALGAWLAAGRDVGSGLLHPKAGRDHATRSLLSPIGLQLRLQRTSILVWTASLFLLGVTYGSVLGDIDLFFSDIDFMEEFLPAVEGLSLTDQFLSVLFVIMAIMASVPAVMQLTKLRSEEKKQRIEPIVSLAVSRDKLLSSYVVPALLTSVVMLSATSAGLGAAAITVIEDGRPFLDYYGAGMMYLPAVLVMTGVAALLIGWLPAWTSIVWGYLAASFVVVYMGNLFQFPDWMDRLTPYGYVPAVPVEAAAFLPAAGLITVALLLTAGAYMGFRRRDLQQG